MNLLNEPTVNQNSSSKVSFIEWFLPLFMILAQYSIVTSFSNYGFAVLSMYTLYLIFVKKQRLLLHKYLFYLLLFIIAITFINFLRLNEFSVALVNRQIVSLIYLVILSAVITRIDFNNLFKSYLIIGSIAMVIMYFQSIRLYVFGVPAVPVTILPVAPENAHFWGDFLGKRPSALFTEPQAYASFMLPLLIMTLKKNLKLIAFLLSISILLSTSTLGIGMVVIIYSYFIFLGGMAWNRKIVLVTVLVIAIYLLFNSPLFQLASTKIANTEVSNNIRLTRGFLLYSSFDLQNKIFGINDNLQSYVLNNVNSEWVVPYIRNESEHLLGYTTTVSGIFTSYGFFSGLLFIWMIFKMYLNEDPNNLIFLMVIIILSFTQTLFFNAWFAFYYIIYLGLNDIKRFNKNYVLLKI